MLSNFIILVISLIQLTHAEDFGDTRCSCKCPDAEAILGDVIDTNYPHRRVYINSTVSAPDCDCEHVVVPVLGLDRGESKELKDRFCPRCICKHETRSVMTIKVVVGIILWIFAMLFIYMIYLVCVDPMFRPRLQRSNISYQNHQDEEIEESFNDENVMQNATQLNSIRPRNVVSKVKNDQKKWKKQVELQRTTVYDRHTMLN